MSITETTEINGGIGDSANASANANANANANGSANSNTNRSANANANGSANSNTNRSANANANTNGSANANANASGGEEDTFNAARQVVDELYATRENFSDANQLQKPSKMKKLISSALQLLDSIPVENRNLPMQCATYEYLRGKVLNVYANYKKEAEEHLAKAVKLNPSLEDAWLSLGNCIVKKGETMAARNCMMLALSKGPNKRILCQLSGLEKNMTQGKDYKVAEVLVEESIKHAKEALAIDVTDGHSWYCLGNALVKSFFFSGAWDLIELQDSLNAYQNAERDAKMKYCLHLSFNIACVNKYLENYEQALSGFEAATSIDPSRNADLEIRKMVELFDIIGILLTAHIQYRELAIMGLSLNPVKSTPVPALDAVKLDPPYKRATLDILQEGVNKAFAIVGKVLFSINNEHRTAMYYSLCDSNYQCYILTVYGARADVIKEGDQVTILDPCYRHQDFTWKGKRYVFESLRVDDIVKQVCVNGHALSPEQTAPASMFVKPKPL